MVNLNSVSSQYNTANNLYHVNFKAEDERRTQQPQRRPQQPQTRPPQRYTQQQLQQQEMLRRRLEEAEKQQKKEKRKSNLTWVLGIGASIAIIASVILGFSRRGGGGIIDSSEKAKQEARKVITKDITNEKTLEQMHLPKELEDVVAQFKTMIEREEGLKEIGAKTNGGILLYGAPGGGKNAFTYGLTKHIQEKYPGSELIFVDVNKFKGEYNGNTENNILTWVNNVLEKAKSNPDKKYVVFMDEFDSIASKGTGSGAETRESFQNAFKTTLQSLLDQENIQVIAATNKASKSANLDQYLDSAIVDRFSRTIHVPMPTKEQLLYSFTEHCQKLPAHRVSPELLDITNPKLNKICEYINQNEGSYRIYNAVLDESKLICEGLDRPTKQAITIQDLVDGMIRVAEQKNWDPKGLETFKKEISKL